MTKIEMINMAIDLSYVYGRIVKFNSMEDCTGNLVNAIDNLVETIVGGEAKSNDSCVGCRYIRNFIGEPPCDRCKNTYQSQWTRTENE